MLSCPDVWSAFVYSTEHGWLPFETFSCVKDFIIVFSYKSFFVISQVICGFKGWRESCVKKCEIWEALWGTFYFFMKTILYWIVCRRDVSGLIYFGRSTFERMWKSRWTFSLNFSLLCPKEGIDSLVDWMNIQIYLTWKYHSHYN